MADPRAELLERVLESPDADEPRLVFADWLIEREDPRGDFISTQIHLRKRLSPSARHELNAKQAALLSEHEEEWAEPARSIATEHAFVRGFIERVKADGNKFLGGYRELLAREPVRSIELECSGADFVKKLVGTDLLGRVANVALRGEFGDEGAQLLARSPYLAKVKSLNLGSTGLTADGAAALAASPHLGSLETLTLTGNEIGSEGLAALATAESLVALKKLYLARNQIDDDGLVSLARSSAMRALEKLGLGGNEEISDEGLSALYSSPNLQRLKSIEHEEA